MPMWRCPHCGTPQHEAARCWVCRRSSTTCSTCRHFRESLATAVGYCGLDPRRAPLRGTELRGCWTARADALPIAELALDPRTANTMDGPPVPVAVDRLRPASRVRPGILEGFVPLELADGGPRILRAAESPRSPGDHGRNAAGPADGAGLPLVPPLVPPVVPDPIEGWAERDSLFGDL